MNRLRYIGCCLWLILQASLLRAQEVPASEPTVADTSFSEVLAADVDSLAAEVDSLAVTVEKKAVDMQELIFGHIGDAYEWHITTIGETHVTIPLPVILKSSERGWFVFWSSAFHHGEKEHEGFRIAESGDYAGKIVESNSKGEEVRPIDLSMTKVAFSLVLNSLLLVLIIMVVSRWYKHKNAKSEAPRGFVGVMEMFIMMVNDDIIKSCIGKDYKRYAPYLLCAFFFIFFNNLMGLIPIFPGGANITGNIAITFVLAMCTFFAVNFFGNKEYWKEIFWPEVPIFLKIPPIMPLIELFGIFTKPFALMVRLFANIMAGHSVILALVGIIFVTASMGKTLCSSMSFVSVIFGIFMNCLELLVAFIQAYVFTMLSAVFIGMSRPEHHHEKKQE